MVCLGLPIFKHLSNRRVKMLLFAPLSLNIRAMKAVVIAVGTEVTSGEILNRNSSEVSGRLEGLGIQVIAHMAVPDDRPLILESLKFAGNQADMVFVTGGLGPTSDDFTREVVAQFVSCALTFREDIWRELQDLYASRGLNIRESHRQQCFFPERSQILRNPVGTAHGFLCRMSRCELYVLPGPPREVDGVFEESVRPLLKAKGIQPQSELSVWKCLGAPESEVAEVVERVMAGHNLALGYRASHPYVYVKVWHPVGIKPWEHDLLKSLQPWLIGDRDFDLAEQWLKQVQHLPSIRLIDEATDGLLAARLEPYLKSVPEGVGIEMVTFAGASDEYGRELQNEPVDSWFAIHSDGLASTYRVSADFAGHVVSRKLSLPYKILPKSDRGRVLMTEEALRIWWQLTRQR